MGGLHPARPPDGGFADQLLAIASDPVLREAVYGRLGEYCHLCRNRLNSLKLSLFLARKLASGTPGVGADWARIESQYLKLERVVDRLQTLCRPMTLSRVTLAIDLLIEDRRAEWTRILADSGCELQLVAPPDRALASFDVERLIQALDGLVRWRAGGPGRDRSASLRWWVAAGVAHLGWDEAGPSDDVDALPESEESERWSLPLLARVVLAHGGKFRLSEAGGLKIELSWPAAPVAT